MNFKEITEKYIKAMNPDKKYALFLAKFTEKFNDFIVKPKKEVF